jgi:hypothetical protein
MTQIEGTFINGPDGELIEITNPERALADARIYVRWHEEAKKARESDPQVRYFKDAHTYWAHILFQIEKLQIQSPHIFKP